MDSVTYPWGDFVTGEIKPIGDTDAFFFFGKTGDAVSITTGIQKIYTTCFTPRWELYAPDGTLVKSKPIAGSDTATLPATGIYTIVVGDGNLDFCDGFDQDADAGQYGLSLQCIGGVCPIILAPDVSGCIKLEGLPLAGRKVILKQPLEAKQTTTTDANGCYKFDNAVPGRTFKVVISGPVVP